MENDLPMASSALQPSLMNGRLRSAQKASLLVFGRALYNAFPASNVIPIVST